MVDPGAAQAVLKQLNRWYRKKAKPHGSTDHYFRGTRMTYTAAYRGVVCFISVLMLSLSITLYFVPGLFTDKSLWVVLFIKIVWIGITVIFILAPLQAFREFAAVNDDGIVKSNLFGRQTRIGWKEIANFQIKPDDNKVTFQTDAKSKLTMSLSYDGWRDFLDLAEKHLAPDVNLRLGYTLSNLDAKRPNLRLTKKTRWAKWTSFGR